MLRIVCASSLQYYCMYIRVIAIYYFRVVASKLEKEITAEIHMMVLSQHWNLSPCLHALKLNHHPD
jgi:hypothetical protein